MTEPPDGREYSPRDATADVSDLEASGRAVSQARPRLPFTVPVSSAPGSTVG